MKNPFPVNLQTSAEVREQGWQAESRDAEGHLISCHAPIEVDDHGIAEWIVECTSRGETVTFWPTNGDVAAHQSPPPQKHVAPDAAARLERILRVGRSMKWTPDGAPALDDEDTAVALGELFQIFFQDAVDRALATTEGSTDG